MPQLKPSIIFAQTRQWSSTDFAYNTYAPSLAPTSAANFTSFIPATIDRGCQDWFFGGSCVRANPEDEPTTAEFGGAIFGIVLASLLLIPALMAFGESAADCDRKACAWGAASVCLLFVLCVSIAALQEVS